MEVKKAKTLGEGNRKIMVRPVETKGENFPSGKNIADSAHGDNNWLGPLRKISPPFPLQDILPLFQCFSHQLRTNLNFVSEKSPAPPLPLKKIPPSKRPHQKCEKFRSDSPTRHDPSPAPPQNYCFRDNGGGLVSDLGRRLRPHPGPWTTMIASPLTSNDGECLSMDL